MSGVQLSKCVRRARAWSVLCFILSLGICLNSKANSALPELFIEDYSLVSYMASSMMDGKSLPQWEDAQNSKLVKLNYSLLAAPRFVLNLSNPLGLVAIRERLVQQAGRQIWIGYIENEPNSSVLLVQTNGIVNGEIYYAGLMYEIQHYQDDLYLVSLLDPFDNPHPRQYADLG